MLMNKTTEMTSQYDWCSYCSSMFFGCTLALLFYKCPQLWRYLCPGHKLDPVSRVRLSCLIAVHWGSSITTIYCTISFNSTPENLVLALSDFGRDKARNSAVRRRRLQNFTIWDCDHQTVSALEKMACYKRYISAILKAAWRVTAELNEIVQ